ncbi:uncharacterized protein EV420DRAFT_565630 [Desarmillaria tabescens]|uniref:Uncharacterized protein n=1 Tax=Armillaria tabescens TaxID=1929756 RepID=A0AA39K6C9_ARMTA|nr:uncharacterized protein EV420DRAFT_565630 [Desarmillaria tabescens]KAK0455391.1 hypothetical protein EV420DRAFT_565630 [Desarmillaria tabescens]
MPVRIKSNKFCCCLPVRLGVLIIGVLGVALGGIIAVGGIIQYTHLGGDIKNKLPYVIQIVVYGLYAIISLGGLVGAVIKRIGLIKTFYFILIVHVMFSIASGSFSIYRYFKDAPDSVRSCVNGSQDDLVVEGCEKGVSVMKGVLIGVFVFVWLMEIWGCMIVKSYSRQLEDEADVKAYANRQWG